MITNLSTTFQVYYVIIIMPGIMLAVFLAAKFITFSDFCFERFAPLKKRHVQSAIFVESVLICSCAGNLCQLV